MAVNNDTAVNKLLMCLCARVAALNLEAFVALQGELAAT